MAVFGVVSTHHLHHSNMKVGVTLSEMTPNYWMMVERYPNLKEEVGGSNSDYEFSSLLDGKKIDKWSTASCALALACRASVSKSKEKKLGYLISHIIQLGRVIYAITMKQGGHLFLFSS